MTTPVLSERRIHQDTPDLCQGTQLRIARVGAPARAGEEEPTDLVAEGPWYGIHLSESPRQPGEWRAVRRALAPGGWAAVPGDEVALASAAGLLPVGSGVFMRRDPQVQAVRAEPRTPIDDGSTAAWVRATQALDGPTRARILAAFQLHPGTTVVACSAMGDMRLSQEDRVWDGVSVLPFGLSAFRRAAVAIRQDVFSSWDLAGVARALARGKLVWLGSPVQTAGQPLQDGPLEAALAELDPVEVGRSRPARADREVRESSATDIRTILQNAKDRPDDARLALRAAQAFDALGQPEDAALMRQFAEDHAMGLWTLVGQNPRLAPVRFSGSLTLLALGGVPGSLHLRVTAEEAGLMQVLLDGMPLGGADLEGPADACDLELPLEGGPDPTLVTLRAGAACLSRARWRV